MPTHRQLQVERPLRSPGSVRRPAAHAGALALQRQVGNAAFAGLVAQRRTVQRDLSDFGLEPFHPTKDDTDGDGSQQNGGSGQAGGDIVGLKRQDGLDFGTWEKRPRVKRLQGLLNDKTDAGLAVDGMWGQKTSNALHGFQTTEGLPETEFVDQVTADRLTGSGPLPAEEDGIIHPEGETAGEVPDDAGGKPKPKGGGRNPIVFLSSIFTQMERQVAEAPQIDLQQEPRVQRDDNVDFGFRWQQKVRCIQEQLRDVFMRLATIVKGLAGQAIGAAADVVHAAITAAGTAIGGPIGFLLGAIGGWFLKNEVVKWIKNKANAAIDKIFTRAFGYVQKLNQGILSLAKPVIQTFDRFLLLWENVVKWADPWLQNAHDVVKWIRDTMAKFFNIKSDKLDAITTTIQDIRAFGRKSTLDCKK